MQLDDVVGDDTLGSFAAGLGLVFDVASGEQVVARWEAVPALHQPYGIVHGGVHATVVETLGSIGGALWYGERGKVVGVSNSTDFFRAVTDGTLVSTATPVHQGRSSQVWLVETRDEQGRLVSRGQLRLQNLAAQG